MSSYCLWFATLMFPAPPVWSHFHRLTCFSSFLITSPPLQLVSSSCICLYVPDVARVLLTCLLTCLLQVKVTHTAKWPWEIRSSPPGRSTTRWTPSGILTVSFTSETCIRTSCASPSMSETRLHLMVSRLLVLSALTLSKMCWILLDDETLVLTFWFAVHIFVNPQIMFLPVAVQLYASRGCISFLI